MRQLHVLAILPILPAHPCLRTLVGCATLKGQDAASRPVSSSQPLRSSLVAHGQAAVGSMHTITGFCLAPDNALRQALLRSASFGSVLCCRYGMQSEKGDLLDPKIVDQTSWAAIGVAAAGTLVATVASF